jgi:hypothetical protein
LRATLSQETKEITQPTYPQATQFVMLPLPLFLNPAESMAFLSQIPTLRRFRLSESTQALADCRL